MHKYSLLHYAVWIHDKMVCFQIRGIVSDFAVTTAILVMVLIHAVVGIRTPTLAVPEEFRVSIACIPLRCIKLSWQCTKLCISYAWHRQTFGQSMISQKNTAMIGDRKAFALPQEHFCPVAKLPQNCFYFSESCAKHQYITILKDIF